MATTATRHSASRLPGLVISTDQLVLPVVGHAALPSVRLRVPLSVPEIVRLADTGVAELLFTPAAFDEPLRATTVKV